LAVACESRLEEFERGGCVHGGNADDGVVLVAAGLGNGARRRRISLRTYIGERSAMAALGNGRALSCGDSEHFFVLPHPMWFVATTAIMLVGVAWCAVKFASVKKTT
jgi:hypothetical protein